MLNPRCSSQRQHLGELQEAHKHLVRIRMDKGLLYEATLFPMAVPQGGKPAAHQLDCCGPGTLWQQKPGILESRSKPEMFDSVHDQGHLNYDRFSHKYKHINVKRCCYDGAHRNDDENCESSEPRIKKGPICIKAFKECCAIASCSSGLTRLTKISN